MLCVLKISCFSKQVWQSATEQALLSTAASSGILIELGSLYNFKDLTSKRQIKQLVLVSTVANILMGMFFFLIIGKIESNHKSVGVIHIIDPGKVHNRVY